MYGYLCGLWCERTRGFQQALESHQSGTSFSLSESGAAFVNVLIPSC
jgi:hypothetical protein